ncbi:hypothetical protein HS1genome_1899 [Sulfodiicoccus acidiphilus]|uniref:Uncharacterized protein n=1 Tax=Sulfodiicoccus acidiphilus TaxID=1670455 RepID=A0A348B5Q8_9CREN|nr:hypothetical protein [Sulfodiicoccus acidiphilus]BBD73510.1 hypothetical protein HS1genome_1899 [Sulfodiicoccus acidiphilus]GGT92630.1 hypothetical protein GCM10007116_08000 [Sulfodiicoccus acidiphilus]
MRNLNLAFADEEQLLQFLWLVKTYLRCAYSPDPDDRRECFGSAKKGRAHMSRVLFVPQVSHRNGENYVLKSLAFYVIGECPRLEGVLENEKGLKGLYDEFEKVKDNYLAGESKLKDFYALFPNCGGSK